MSSSDADDRLLDELRSVIGQADPVPAEVTEFAQAALGWRRLEAELAELLADSALDTRAPALARSGDAGRWLTFRADDVSIEVEIRTEEQAHTLLGQLTPPSAQERVELQDGDGSVVATAEADVLGRFRLEFGGSGRFRLRVARAVAPVETSWFSV